MASYHPQGQRRGAISFRRRNRQGRGAPKPCSQARRLPRHGSIRRQTLVDQLHVHRGELKELHSHRRIIGNCPIRLHDSFGGVAANAPHCMRNFVRPYIGNQLHPVFSFHPALHAVVVHVNTHTGLALQRCVGQDIWLKPLRSMLIEQDFDYIPGLPLARGSVGREDYLPAPLFAVSLRNGDSLTILDQAPQGHTTTQEATVDERFSFGGFGADETADGGFEMGYWMPGTTVAVGAPGGRGAAGGGGGGYFGTTGGRGQTPQTPQPGPPQPGQLTWTRRYNPVKEGFTQSYQLGFRFGSRESFPDLIRNSYRWAWQV